jgi:tRNA (mo5U34)-methyltransferase
VPPPSAVPDDLRRRVGEVGFWWHSIDLGGGVVTPGHKTPGYHAGELQALALPELAGRTVLDVGSWDGYYAFHAERAGAARVVALDHYVWSLDLPRHRAIHDAQVAKGEVGAQPHDLPEVWDPEGLPGKRGFDLAHAELGSAVEPVVGDYATLDPETLGRFDVVLFLGVLYHLRDPLGAMRKLHALCDGVAVIETEAIALGSQPDACLWEFMGTRKHLHDPTNWWAPTRAGLEGICRAAGFSRIEPGPVPDPQPAPGTTVPFRAVVHAWR